MAGMDKTLTRNFILTPASAGSIGNDHYRVCLVHNGITSSSTRPCEVIMEAVRSIPGTQRPGSARRVHRGVSMITLLVMTLLFGCDESRPIDTDVRESVSPETPPIVRSTPLPTPSESRSQQEPPHQAVEKRIAKTLDLTIDATPAPGQATAGFGGIPEAEWLNKDQAAAGLGAGPDTSRVLPDLFDENTSEKPVSVKGKLLVDDEAGDISSAVEGAGLSLEYRTE